MGTGAADSRTAAQTFEYDAFVSYTTRPDYRFARALKGFLESFHRIKTPDAQRLRPLRVCIDGVDFSIAAAQRAASNKGQPTRESDVKDIISHHLSRSRVLLVLCAGAEYETSWRGFELEWWLDNRDASSIHLVATRGDNPAADAETFFPQRARAAGLHKRIWFDLRGHTRSARVDARQLRDFDEERTRLAAELYEKTVGELQPIWLREQRRRLRALLTGAGVVLALMMGLSILAWTQRQLAVASARRADEARLVAVGQRANTMLETPSGWLDALPLAMSASLPGLVAGGNPMVLKGALARAVFAAVPVVEAPTNAFHAHLALSGDSQVVAIVNESTLELRRADTGASIATARVDDWMRDVAITRTGDAVVTAGRSGARIWSARPLATRCVIPCGGEVFQVHISPDERRALTTCTDRSHQVYDIATCRKIATLGVAAQRDPAGALVDPYFINYDHIATFSPDGERVAIPDRQAGFAVWSVKSGRPVARYGAQGRRVSAATFARAAERVLAFEGPNHAAVWDLPTAARKLEEPARAAALSDDGAALLTYGNNAVHVVSVEAPEKRVALRGPEAAQPAFSADGRRACGSAGDGAARVWDTKTGEVLLTVKGRTELIDNALLSRDGLKLITSGRDGVVRVWDLSSTLANHGDLVRTLEFSPDGSRVVSGAWDGQVQLWDPHTGALRAAAPAHEGEVFAAPFSNDGRVFVTASAGMVHVLDGRDGKLVRDLTVPDQTVMHIALAGDGTRVVATDLVTDGLRDVAVLWDARTGARRHIDETNVADARFLGDGRIVLLRRGSSKPGDTGAVSVWSADGLRRESELPGSMEALEEIIIAPGGTRLAALCRTTEQVRLARLWDGTRWIPFSDSLGIAPDRAHDAGLVFSNDGRRAATYALDPIVRTWDGETGQLVATAHAGAGQVDRVQFIAQTGYIMTHDLGGTALIFDATTGEALGRFDGVSTARVSPDGSILAAASGSRLRFFERAERAVFARGCELIGLLNGMPALTAPQQDELVRACAGFRR